MAESCPRPSSKRAPGDEAAPEHGPDFVFGLARGRPQSPQNDRALYVECKFAPLVEITDEELDAIVLLLGTDLARIMAD